MSVSHHSSKGNPGPEEAWQLEDEHLAEMDEVELRLYKDMTVDQMQEYKEIYDIFDSDGSGNINQEEVAQVMRTLG